MFEQSTVFCLPGVLVGKVLLVFGIDVSIVGTKVIQVDGFYFVNKWLVMNPPHNISASFLFEGSLT